MGGNSQLNWIGDVGTNGFAFMDAVSPFWPAQLAVRHPLSGAISEQDRLVSLRCQLVVFNIFLVSQATPLRRVCDNLSDMNTIF